MVSKAAPKVNSLYVLTNLDIYRFEQANDKNLRLDTGDLRGMNEGTDSIIGSDRTRSDKNKKIRYKTVPINGDCKISEMFQFIDNKFHVKCNFEGVKSLYKQYQQDKQNEFTLSHSNRFENLNMSDKQSWRDIEMGPKQDSMLIKSKTFK